MDEMKAGRELDALIAEKVMGWVRGGQDDYTKPYHAKRKVIEEDGSARVEHYLNWGDKGPHDRITSPDGKTIYLCGCKDYEDSIPPYSTEIAAAWAVMEKLKSTPYFKNSEDKGTISELRLTWSKGPNEWTARVWNDEFIEESSSSAPHAICLAALKAVGNERLIHG